MYSPLYYAYYPLRYLCCDTCYLGVPLASFSTSSFRQNLQSAYLAGYTEWVASCIQATLDLLPLALVVFFCMLCTLLIALSVIMTNQHCLSSIYIKHYIITLCRVFLFVEGIIISSKEQRLMCQTGLLLCL